MKKFILISMALMLIVGMFADVIIRTDTSLQNQALSLSGRDRSEPLPYIMDFEGFRNLAAIDWAGTMSITSAHGNGAGSYGMFKKLTSSNRAANAVTCPIGPMVAGAALDFEYRFVNSAGFPNNPVGTTLGANDKVEIRISTDGPQGIFTTVHTINQANHVTANVFTPVTVDLSAYNTGDIQIEFLATWGSGDYFVQFDNVAVYEIPTNPIFVISPDDSSWDFGVIPVGDSREKEFTISNIGVGTLSINSISIDNNPAFSVVELEPINHALAVEENTTFKVVFNPQAAEGPQSATLTIDYGTTDTPYTVLISGRGYLPAVLPLTETWEDGQGDWLFVNGEQTNAWHIGTADPYEGENSAYISNDSGVYNAYTTHLASVAHIYRDIVFDTECIEFPLSFAWQCAGETPDWDRMRVYLVDTSTTPVAGTELTLGRVGLANYNGQAEWTTGTITLPGTLSGTVKRLVFSWRNDNSNGTQAPINLDSISLTAVSGPVLPANLSYPANNQINLPIEGFPFQFSWNMGGSEPDVYNLYVANMANLSEGFDSDEFFSIAQILGNVTSPYNSGNIYEYGVNYAWTVGASNSSFPTEVYQWPPFEFKIQDDPTITLPHAQNFDGIIIPNGWTQSSKNIWSLSSTELAGGTANEMKASWISYDGITRLVSPPIDTNGINGFTVSFKTLFEDDGAGITAKLQYSHDLSTWQDTPWNISSGGGNVSGIQNTLVNGLVAQPVTYVAWTLDGFHLRYNRWYVDDVSLEAMLDTPVVNIAADGTLSWTPVRGADSYIVASSIDPEGPFSFVANLPSAQTSWLDPAFGADKMFYQVMASPDTPAKNVVSPNTSRNIPSNLQRQ